MASSLACNLLAMSDSDTAPGPADDGSGAGGSPLPPARPPAPRPPRAAPRPARPPGAKPTPVRSLSEPTAAPTSPVDADLDQAEVTVEGRTWIVEVLGRAGAPAAGEAPLLLLGFSAEGAGEGGPRKEALVVGRTLRGLAHAELERALGAAREPSAQGPPAEVDGGRERRPGSRRRGS